MVLDVTQIRPPAVAGTFYPAEPAQLTRMVEDCLTQAPAFHGKPKAIIAPHAGFVFSGQIAGSAYAALKQRRDAIRRVVLLGPCHRVAVRNFAVPSHQAFATPLGPVTVDRATVDRLLRHDWVEVNDAAHLPEHCLETQLPFLQRLLSDFSIVPVIVGGAPAQLTDQLLQELWGGEETLIVISSDLSHYQGYDDARQLDLAACQAIEALEPGELKTEQACGRYPIYGLLARARALDLRATTLDLRSSGDTGGRERRDRVVGYAAVAFEDAESAALSRQHRQQLITAAGRTIASGVTRGRQPDVAVETYPWPLRARRASFVTLKIDDKLRGCVGSVKPHQPMITDVVASAYKAGFGDKRFSPLSAEEIGESTGRMSLSVSILSHPRPLSFETEAQAAAALRPAKDGVILQDKNRRGLFLPQVWDSIGDAPTFLRHLKVKAGLPEDYWSEDLRLFRFTTETFGARIKAGEQAA